MEANDADLPVVAGPSKAKRRKRQSKNKRDALTTRWSAQTLRVQPEKAFQGFAEDGNIRVGVDHTLPVDATPYDYLCLLLPDTFWTDVAHQTDIYAEQRAGQDLEGDRSCVNETLCFHSVYVWDLQNGRKGHVLVL